MPYDGFCGKLLSRIRHERSSQPVFTPQFLARMGRILVFRPLDEPAMVGIAKRMLARVESTWSRKRGKRLSVPEELVTEIGRRAHAENTKSGGKEGGRIMRRLLTDLLETPIQDAADADPEGFRGCERVVVEVDGEREEMAARVGFGC